MVAVARRLVRQKFFGDHPLAIDSHGTEEGLKAVTPAGLRALHKQLLVTGNCVLAVTGDFEPRQLTPKLKAFLAKLPKGSVLNEIEAEIRRMQDGGITPDELLRCQTRLKAARRMSLQTNGARAMQAALNAVYCLPVNDWKNYDAKIEAVTIEQLRDFARRYFTPEQRVELIVRP